MVTSDAAGTAESPDSKRARTFGGVDVSVVSLGICAVATSDLDTEAVYGHITGCLLDPEKVKLGRRLERQRMDAFTVFRKVPLNDAVGRRVKSKWLDDVKIGPDGTEIVRSRLVAMQLAWDYRWDTFAGTPPLPAVRMMLSFAATLQSEDRRHTYLLGVWDVSVAFFHTEMDERIVVIPPRG